jgi:hypothetical protein
MRDDMSKVLVESPRSGRAYARLMEGTRRRQRNRLDPDGEGGRNHSGMQRDGNKHFGEHLGPLFRYLRQQVDRPWAKVYGELCAQLDRRNVVQAHIFQHIGQEVELDTVWQDDQVWVRGWRGLRPLSESRAAMYVHPLTGILLPNRARIVAAQRRRQAREHQRNAQPLNRRTGLPGMATDTQWHRLDGIWYELQLGVLADGSKAYDVVLKREVSLRDSSLLRDTYGCATRYATTKRQLGHKALRQHGLVSQALA